MSQESFYRLTPAKYLQKSKQIDFKLVKIDNYLQTNQFEGKSTSENFASKYLMNDSSSESDPSYSEYSTYKISDALKDHCIYSPQLESYKQLDEHLQNIQDILKTDTISKGQFDGEKKKLKTYNKLKSFVKLVEGDGSLYQLFNQCCGSTNRLADMFKKSKYIKLISKILKLLNMLVVGMLNTKIQFTPQNRVSGPIDSKLFGSISVHSKINENLKQSQVTFKSVSPPVFISSPAIQNQLMKSQQITTVNHNPKIESISIYQNRVQQKRNQIAKPNKMETNFAYKKSKPNPVAFDQKRKNSDSIQKRSNFNVISNK